MKPHTKSLLRAATLLGLVIGAVLALSPGASGKPLAHSARTTAPVAARPATAEGPPPAQCVIHTLPSFVAQGEYATAATVGDVIEVECNPFAYGTGSTITITAAQLYTRCGGDLTWYVAYPFRTESDSRSVTLTLDADGNATVALIAGPDCQAGESLISAHETEEPYESFSDAFTVLPPQETAEGVFALPASQVELSEGSSFATLIEAEFPGASEKPVRIGSEELFRRCRTAPGLVWVTENRTVIEGTSEVNGSAPAELKLDDDGNVFVLALGDSSCYPGSSLIEADLESKPFTTLTGGFTVEPPQPTAEPGVKIEKLQQLSGKGGGFTTAKLEGAIGETVEYEIVVTNTSTVSETLSEFSDANCDAGTIAGGPGTSPLTAGSSTTYTCDHVLTKVGPYVNVASVDGSTPGGVPVKQTSNEVEVVVPPGSPAFTIEKQQRIAGSGSGYTTATLTGFVGQTVEYDIVVKNTGNTPLTLSGFSDAHCDAGTITGGPGATPLAPGGETAYTCTHVLVSVGKYVNEATVTGTPPGEGPSTHTSPPVEVEVKNPEPGFKVQKLQRIAGSGGGYSAAELSATVGQTIEYEIVVTNTGNEPLTFSAFSDAHCDTGTLAGGPGSSLVAPGESTTYTCTHLIATEGKYDNIATVSGGPPGGEQMMQPSPEVKVVAAQHGVEHNITTMPKCPTKPVLKGASGPKSRKFTVSVKAAGIKKIVFYLDGHKIRTLRQSQARGGYFRITVNPGKLSVGAHRISIRTTMLTAGCATTATGHTFVKPFSARVKPNYTG